MHVLSKNKLVLKKGDKVFDSFLFPNQEGVVKDVEDYLIVVDFAKTVQN